VAGIFFETLRKIVRNLRMFWQLDENRKGELRNVCLEPYKRTFQLDSPAVECITSRIPSRFETSVKEQKSAF
jgi:hypothetical protein